RLSNPPGGAGGGAPAPGRALEGFPRRGLPGGGAGLLLRGSRYLPDPRIENRLGGDASAFSAGDRVSIERGGPRTGRRVRVGISWSRREDYAAPSVTFCWTV